MAGSSAGGGENWNRLSPPPGSRDHMYDTVYNPEPPKGRSSGLRYVGVSAGGERPHASRTSAGVDGPTA
jgi:hypothetical protein